MEISITTLWLLTAFTVKHFVCDFPLQRSYQWRNKGIYGHPGGLLHAGIHALGTFLVLLPLPLSSAAFFALADGVVHYHIDWSKAKLSKRYQLSYSHDAFWILFGMDQMLHMLMYCLLTALILNQ